jgi:hypothetical protein
MPLKCKTAIPLETLNMLANCTEISLSGKSMQELISWYFLNWPHAEILFNPIMKRFIVENPIGGIDDGMNARGDRVYNEFKKFWVYINPECGPFLMIAQI